MFVLMLAHFMLTFVTCAHRFAGRTIRWCCKMRPQAVSANLH